MTDTIFGLSKGEYSDYWVVAMFETEEKAKEVATTLNESVGYEDYRVEEFPLINTVEFTDYLRMSFSIDPDGSITWEREYSAIEHKELSMHPKCQWHYHWNKGFDNGNPKRFRPAYGSFVIDGTDVERIRKVYSEKRAFYIANEVERRITVKG